MPLALFCRRIVHIATQTSYPLYESQSSLAVLCRIIFIFHIRSCSWHFISIVGSACLFFSCSPAATYNLSIRVGDVKGSGTDGNVYIQLFGERGNTAKIQLRQAGDTKNKFEKGRTYKFTVDTVDIGKVRRVLVPPTSSDGAWNDLVSGIESELRNFSLAQAPL